VQLTGNAILIWHDEQLLIATFFHMILIFVCCILLRPLLWQVFGCAVNRNSFLFIFSYSHHYMFRPLQVILRWNIRSFLKLNYNILRNIIWNNELYSLNGSVGGVIAFKNDYVYFTWGWPVKAETFNDVNRRIWTKTLLLFTAHSKTSHSFSMWFVFSECWDSLSSSAT
jgi:hypothetical protein